MKYNNVLFYKWIAGNSFGFLLLFIVWSQGWLELVVTSDASYLTWVMGAVFIVFWLMSSYYVLVTTSSSQPWLQTTHRCSTTR